MIVCKCPKCEQIRKAMKAGKSVVIPPSRKCHGAMLLNGEIIAEITKLEFEENAQIGDKHDDPA